MLLDRANQIPPFICRIIARKRVTARGVSRMEPLSHNDIAEATQLPRSTVADISVRESWDGISMDVADKFASACGVDLTQPGRHLRWLRAVRIRHLAAGNAQQRRFFARLFQRKGT